MFDNLLNQPVEQLLTNDIIHNKLPNSLLFSGPINSGKFTCALEIARILSCRGNPKGDWLCSCSSCLKHKALVSSDVLIAGSKDITLEIAGARQSLLNSINKNADYIDATRYLFVRSVRKLTNRFNPVMWQGDKNLSKISGYTSVIDELLEELDPLRPLLEYEKVDKISQKILEQCQKLESNCMYNSLPIAQMRNIANWARYTVAEGKKVVIIENADRMLDSVRNAVLKILEEPPAGCLFILTTANRSAIISTILSRVRTYNFAERTSQQKQDVVNRVFHNDYKNIEEYLTSFLPVESQVIQDNAMKFLQDIFNGINPDVVQIAKNCGNFDPKLLLKLFFNVLYQYQRKILFSITDVNTQPQITENLVKISKEIRNAYDQITIYNQSPIASLENLASRLMR